MQQKYLLIHYCLPCDFYLNLCCCHDLSLPHRIMNLGFISVLCPDLYSRQSVWKSKEKKILTWIFSSEVKTKTLAKTQTLLFVGKNVLFVCLVGVIIPGRNGGRNLPGAQTLVLSSHPNPASLLWPSFPHFKSERLYNLLCGPHWWQDKSKPVEIARLSGGISLCHLHRA